MGHLDRHATIEHVTDRGRRVGNGSEQHSASIGMCTWHHFGYTEGNLRGQEMTEEYGPSLANGRRVFEEYYGDEVDILIPTQNLMLAIFEVTPWPEYSVPRNVAAKTVKKWIDICHVNINDCHKGNAVVH
jgi:hypothetical protein